MHIGNSLPSLCFNYQAAGYYHPGQSAGIQPSQGLVSQAAVVDISPETFASARQGKMPGKAPWEAYALNKTQASLGSQRSNLVNNPAECKTCASRKYKDASNDPSVSFQSATHISPGQSAASVSAHESEHVSNEQVKADKDNREIISQTVTLKTSICPECKRVYVAGGETRTISKQKNEEG
jgi:predicted Zn-ribbon and HTH transcriptional regulator